MTGAELAAEIAEAIAQDSRLDAIREKIEAGTADLKDSEQYTAICAEITGRMMRGAVAGLDDREESFTEIARERYRETFDIYSTVQAIIDRALGIRIAAKEPGFQEDRARKIGHALEDQTVPESTILRRAESASENFVMSQHDRCVEENAKFRDRAGLQSYAVRTGGAKCCQWCADVSGKYPANETPDGFWDRHDNCKCSILYESKRSGRQLLRGTSKKWEVAAEGAGAGELHRMTKAQAEMAGAPPLVRLSNAELMASGKKEMIDVPPIQHSTEEKMELAQYARSLGFKFENAMQFDGDIDLLKEQLAIMAKLRDEFQIPRRIVLQVKNLGGDCGETAGRRTIRINSSAMRSDDATSAYFNSDNKLSSSRAIGIGVHEIGHLITKKYGEIGLDIARQACYNVSGKKLNYIQTLDFLLDNVSEYSITKNPDAKSPKFKPTHYHEVIPEVLGKHFTNPDEFTTEFFMLLKGACQV